MFTTYDAVQLLRQDHERMKDLIQAFHDTDKNQLEEKELLVYELFFLLYLHFQINDTVLYPEIEKALKDDPLLEYAQGLQNEARDLIAQIEALSPSDPAWQGLVLDLEDTVHEHIRDEESEICSRFQMSDVDLAGLGRRLAEKKEELLNEEQSWRKSA